MFTLPNLNSIDARYKNETNSETKVTIANTLIREMAIHGDAEYVWLSLFFISSAHSLLAYREVSVYNHFPSLGLGDTEAHNKEEHAEIKKLVYKADTTSTSHDNYDQVLIKAVTTFISHAQEEENDQFPKIKASLTPEASDVGVVAFVKCAACLISLVWML